MTRSRFPRWFVALAAALLAIPASAAGGTTKDNALIVRVSGALGRPGGRVAIVLRTYAMRPIRQGQIKVTTSSSSTTKAQAVAEGFAAVRGARRTTGLAASGGGLRFAGAKVFSAADDALANVTSATTSTDTAVTVAFSSPSGSVNASSGPLAVLFFTVEETALPGTFYSVRVDTAGTYLVAATGEAIAVAPRNGDLTLVAPGEPFTATVDGDKVPPGGVATFGLSTLEPLSFTSGRVTLLYDDSFAAGPATVTFDPRYGNVSFVADTSPGRVVVDFVSLDGSFGTVPGALIAAAVPIAADAPPGSQALVWVDPAETYFFDTAERPVPLSFEDGLIVVR